MLEAAVRHLIQRRKCGEHVSVRVGGEGTYRAQKLRLEDEISEARSVNARIVPLLCGRTRSTVLLFGLLIRLVEELCFLIECGGGELRNESDEESGVCGKSALQWWWRRRRAAEGGGGRRRRRGGGGQRARAPVLQGLYLFLRCFFCHAELAADSSVCLLAQP